MIIFIINAVFLLLLEMLLRPEESRNRRAAFCFVFGLIWAILSSARTSIFGDTGQYIRIFYEDASIQINECLASIIPQITLQEPLIEEPGYHMLSKVVYAVGGDYGALFIIIAIFVSFSLAYFIYDNSEDPIWGCLLYSCVFFPFLSMSAMRQSIAIALVAFLGYSALKRNRKFTFLVLVVVGMLFHKSAIFGLFLLPAFSLKLDKRFIITSALLFIILIIFHTRVLNILVPLIGYDNYVGSTYVGSRTVLYLGAYLAIWTISLWRRPRCLESFNASMSRNIVIFTIGVLICAFSFDNSNAFRATFYYSFTMFFLVPCILSSFSIKARTLLMYLYIVFCGLALVLLSPMVMTIPLSTPIESCFMFFGLAG